MGNTIAIYRAFLWLALVLPMLAVAACAPIAAAGVQFDIPAQSAGPALNAFARQADITLIFSYDLVANDRTHALKGRYTVDRGLAVLLDGTGLGYRRSPDGTYLICPRERCAPLVGPGRQTRSAGPKQAAGGSGGNPRVARLHH